MKTIRYFFTQQIRKCIQIKDNQLMITELVLWFTKLGMCKVQDNYRKLSLSISKRMGVVSLGKENNKEESLEEE